jgi:mRNA interferase RelE/StbE
MIAPIPHFGNNIKKLRSYVPEMWRFRIGKFRVFYSINEDDKIVFIITVEFRKDSYIA